MTVTSILIIVRQYYSSNIYTNSFKFEISINKRYRFFDINFI